MKRFVSVAVAGAIVVLGLPGAASAGQDLLRDVLRQQSAAQREGCVAVKRTLATEPNAALVVRTAVELGYNACQVIRCAIEGGADLAKVVQGAAEAGVKADVVARCSVEAGADAASVARIFAELVFEPSFCYVTFSPAGAPDPRPPVAPAADQSYRGRVEASPFTF
jgi:hypothetical protein